MSTELDMNVLGSPSIPLSSMISGIPSTPSSSTMWVPEVPSYSATQPVSSTQPTGMNPFISLFGMSSHDSQSISLTSNPFYFGMPNMTSQLSSSVSMTNVNPSFGFWGMTPPYVPFSFGGGHIPQENATVGGWNPPSSKPNPIFSARGWSAQMGRQFTSYIISLIPSSSTPIPMNSFIMENPPLYYRVPSGGIQFHSMGTPQHGVSSFGGNVYNP
jgi:hypothetical protein